MKDKNQEFAWLGNAFSEVTNELVLCFKVDINDI